MPVHEAKQQVFLDRDVQDPDAVPSEADECDLHGSIDRFFAPRDEASLVSRWLTALDGVQAALEKGARVAHVGCGFGSATILMARSFPKSRFFGFDSCEVSVLGARAAADKAGAAERVHFQLASSTDFPGWDFDLVTFFDCLHDMTNRVGAARRVRTALAQHGTWMIVEPNAADRIEEIREVVEAGGFTRFRRAIETPLTLVFEARL